MSGCPVISVVLPCFNALSTLSRAIESIRVQTFEDWELLVWDDGSSDGSADVAEAFCERDGRIRVVRARHGGIVAALSSACGEVRGDFIARMDADDVAYPERLARQLACMGADSRMGLCGTQVRMVGVRVGSGRRRYEGWINRLVSDEDIQRELFVECPVPHPTFLMRREAYESVGGYQEHGWAEDYDLCMRMSLAGWRLGKVAGVLLDWTESPGRLSMSSDRYSESGFRALKRHYLFQRHLDDRVVFHQWGAGEVGKRWLREWGARRPEAVVDINPRKIRRQIHGYQVISPDDLPQPGETFVVVAVGAPEAREEIRAWFAPRGYVELRDYLFLA